LTACCARHNEASGGALSSTEAAGSTTDAVGRVQPRRSVIGRGRPARHANAPPPCVHNVTPAGPSDGSAVRWPGSGCSLSHHGGAETAKRPGRQAGLRYSAGRAPGGRGRFIDNNGVHRSVARRRGSAIEGLAAFRPTVPRQRRGVQPHEHQWVRPPGPTVRVGKKR
jgi:hypothetical protein